MKPEDWQPTIDQAITGSDGNISFARTHYLLPPKKDLETLFKNRTLALMQKTCKQKRLKIIRAYNTESDWVTLRVNYRGNPPVRVFEFNCL